MNRDTPPSSINSDSRADQADHAAAASAEQASEAQSIHLSTPMDRLKAFVNPNRAKKLRKLGIKTVSDLLRHIPHRYDDQAAESTVAALQEGTIGTARGTIVATRPEFARYRGGKHRFVATLEDETGRLNLTWFNALYLKQKIQPGLALRVTGTVKSFQGYPQMINPKWEPMKEDEQADEAALSQRYRPIYPATEHVPSGLIESWVQRILPLVLDQVPDPLPEDLRQRLALPPLPQALRMIHQPTDLDEAGHARRRLAFNELFMLQLGMAVKRYQATTALQAWPMKHSRAIDEQIRQRFPFTLTDAQDTVIQEIVADMQQPKPMNRMVQGDVGAGKTVVALYAMLLAVTNGKQAALMAPTEILAEQHYLSIQRMLEGSNVRVELLIGALRTRQRNDRQRLIASGEVDIIIGTQALLTESVRFKDLAVAVIDEQHRFGVRQRARLRQQGEVSDQAPEQDPSLFGPPASERFPPEDAGAEPVEPEADAQEGVAKLREPHFLLMTATPIPRTLSLTVFADLDVSVIQGLPPGRTPILTRVVGQEKSDDVYRYLVERLSRGEQAYVVVPSIDQEGEEEQDEESEAVLKSVQRHTKLLQEKYCGEDYQVLSLHGKMKRDEREAIMARFRAGEAHVLVATTVIEVGVDVPNATVMVVEHAERFGLAQLHQLRGRVGRKSGGPKSLCVFIAEPSTEEAGRRMKAIGSTTDGFKIAELDLEIRGMGDFFGTRQSGMPPLRVANLASESDLGLLKVAKKEAAAMIEADPTLEQPEHRLLRRLLEDRFGESIGLIDVG